MDNSLQINQSFPENELDPLSKSLVQSPTKARFNIQETISKNYAFTDETFSQISQKSQYLSLKRPIQEDEEDHNALEEGQNEIQEILYEEQGPAQFQRLYQTIKCTTEAVPVSRWSELQQNLKQEYQQMNYENDLKEILLKEVNEESYNYYQTYLNVLEEQSTNQQKKHLVTSATKLFGNASTYLIQIFQQLSQNPCLFAQIFNYHNGITQSNAVQSLVQTVVHSFYDNVASESMWHQPIMKLLSDVVGFEVNRFESPDLIKWDKQDSLAQYILEEFTKRSENVKFTKVIYKNALLQITKVEGHLELDPLKISNKLRDRKKLKEQQLKPNMLSTMTPMNRSMIGKNMAVQPQPIFQITQQSPKLPVPESNMQNYYAQIFKMYDTIKKKDNRKNPNQLSEHLTKLLVFNDEQSQFLQQAKFTGLEKKSALSQDENGPDQELNTSSRSSGGKQEEMKSFSEYYNHQNRSEVQHNTEVKRVLNSCIEKLKSLVNIIIDSIFKNIYNLPVGLRIVCKFIQIHLQRKFPAITELQIQDNIFSFLFNQWLIPQFKFPHQYLQLKFIREEHEQTVNLIHKILRKLVKRQPFEDSSFDYSKLNIYINDLQPSLTEYLRELLNLSIDPINDIINLDMKSFMEKQKQITFSSCVCMPLPDIKTLCVLLKDFKDYNSNEKEETEEIRRLSKRAIMTIQISEDQNSFGNRTDIFMGQTLQPSQVFALIIDFQLPQNLQVNYIEFLNKLFKCKYKSCSDEERLLLKVKNVMKKLLTDIPDINQLSEYANEKISIQKLLQIQEDRLMSNVNKQTQLITILRYAQTMINKLPEGYRESNLKQILEEMELENFERSNKEQQIIIQTRYELLRAKQNIKKNYDILKDALEQLKKESRRKKLYEFIEKTPISWCITSPKTREGLYSVKAMRMRNNQQIDEDKIWVENQKECIHNAINLEFIKQIVGGGASDTRPSHQKSDFNNYHCDDIRGFIEIFASLPEVRDAVISGEDKAGVKEAYFEIITPLVDHSRDNYKMNANEQSDPTEALEKYVSRKIYEKVFPKERLYKDAALYFRIKTLDWLVYDNLEISNVNRVDEMWALAADALIQMDNSKTALDKMESMLQCTKIMTDVLRLTSLKDEPASADTTLPIMIYILIKAAPQRLYSNLNFVELFINDTKMVGEPGYCLKQIQSAIYFLETFKPSVIKMDNYQFQKEITKNEIKYGLHYIKKRGRNERQTFTFEQLEKIKNQVSQQSSI